MPETHSCAQADTLADSQAQAQAVPGFMQIQQAFTAHLRDPDQQPPPAGIEDRRVRIYRELIFNNVASLLEQGFPVLYQCLGRERWRALIRGFLIAHRAETPLFPELGQELLAYLSTAGALHPEDPPFVLELAHYEWVETALIFSEAEAGPALADPNGDLLDGVPVVSPLAWNLSYRFPVHRISAEFQPQAPDPEPTHLVVYRTQQERIEFLKINVVTQRLLVLLREHNHRSGRDLLNSIALELQHPRPSQLIEAGRSLLDDLRERQILLGTRRQ